MQEYTVAIVGATGVVGQTFVELLEERALPVCELRLFASQQSQGKTIRFGEQELPVAVLHEHAFKNTDFAFFSAGAAVSKTFAPMAVHAGCTVIDNSSAFRMVSDVPLVVPEVNFETIRPEQRLIANPNCSTIQMVMVLQPLHRIARLKRVVVSTYQAVSGTGKEALKELTSQSQAVLSGKPVVPQVYPQQIAFNALPHIDTFLDDGYTGEEMKMINETRKILGLPELAITATCVRVPVMNGHSESVNIEFEKPISPEKAREVLNQSAGIIVQDAPQRGIYPLATGSSGKNEVFVGRIRADGSVAHGLNMWIVADNLRKGAALNAIQIAERLIATK